MENDIEQARASNMEEDKASTPNKGKDIHVGSASDIEMATNFLEKLYTDVGEMHWQRNGYESDCRSEGCIYRVPKPLRDVNSKVYVPNLISIGPLHRENKGLEAMEKEKLNYIRKLTEQYGVDEKKMCDIVISIKNQEERLRNCYSEKSILMESSDDFLKMILLDTVFIIQFFLESNDDKGDITGDLMLLENQLPLFIIQEIYDRVNPRGKDAKANPFLDLATCHLRKYLRLQGVETSPGVEGSRHFTDLLRNLILNRAIKRSKYYLNPIMLKYSAFTLRKAGVRFQVTRDECLVNIKFDKGVLKIPQLVVDHNFERLVRNIMAMEQCVYEREAYICSYIKFMDQLIDSAEDVGLLVEKGIIVHMLGDSAAVSNMINRLGNDIGDINYTCFGDISQELNAHFERRFYRMLIRVAIMFCPIALILTFIQTIVSIISLF